MDKHGGNIYGNENIILDFSVSLSPLGMPEGIKEAIRNSVDSFGDYPDSNQGKLREAIGRRYGVSSEKIICGNGAADLIYRIPFAIERMKDKTKGSKTEGRALIIQPAFSCYEEALKEAGFEIDDYVLDENAGFLPGDDLLETISRGNYDVVFACNPSNPVGALMEKEYVLRLAQTCKEKNTYLLLDECFLELTGKADELSLINHNEGNDYLIILRSFTKTFAMAGLRLGYIISENESFIKEMMSIGQPWPISKPAEAAGIKAIEEKTYVKEVNAFLEGERRRVKDELSSLGLKVYEPSSNYIFFLGPEGLKEELLKKRFLIRDCSNFKGLEKPAWNKEKLMPYRIGLKNQDENRALLEAMKNVL